jgi:hypothetical protein
MTGPSLPESLVPLLACPKCKGALVRLADPEGFGCVPCGLFYAVVDGVPDFLIEEAVPWSPAPPRQSRTGRSR